MRQYLESLKGKDREWGETFLLSSFMNMQPTSFKQYIIDKKGQNLLSKYKHLKSEIEQLSKKDKEYERLAEEKREVNDTIRELQHEWNHTTFSALGWTMDLVRPTTLYKLTQEINRVAGYSFKDNLSKADVDKMLRWKEEPLATSGVVNEIIKEGAGLKRADAMFYQPELVTQKIPGFMETVSEVRKTGLTYEKALEKLPRKTEAEVEAYRKTLTEILKDYPHVFMNFESIFKGHIAHYYRRIAGIAPEEITLKDMKEFVTAMKWAQQKPGGEFPFKGKYWFMSPEYVGQGAMQRHDFRLETMRGAVMTKRGLEFHPVKVFMTNMERIRQLNNSVHHFKDTAKQEQDQYFGTEDPVVKRINALNRIEKHLGDNLARIATRMFELGEGESGSLARAEYQKRWKEAVEEFKPYDGKVYSIPDGKGGKEQVSSRKIITDMQEALKQWSNKEHGSLLKTLKWKRRF